MATLFHLDVLRLSPRNQAGTQFIEIIGSGSLTTPDDPEGTTYPLPAEYHPMIVAIADTLRFSEVRDQDGVRRFFFREYGSGDCRLVLQVQPFHDFLVASQQDSANHGALVAHDCGIDLRVNNHGLYNTFAYLNFLPVSGTLTNRVDSYILNESEIRALIDVLAAIRDGRLVTDNPLIGNESWRDKLNELAAERVGMPYLNWQMRRGEVAA